MKCDKCGYSDNGTGDWAHACGPVAIQRQPIMNSRIRELWSQAEEEIKAEYEDESRRNRRLYNEIFLPKFAELLIKECISINRQRQFSDYEGDSLRVAHNNALSCATSDMFEHFGVEE